ncbi:hypothetical protein [Saccharothrix syringae]|uniref:hypothetical protein n=1 Tax=Saccharothrix syringae TaxID=103733 RepID=UPI000A82F40E|nr:hypothetical protein [Saccharothrix syringae]
MAVLLSGKTISDEVVVMVASDKGMSYWKTYTVVIEFSAEGYRWRREGDGLPELVE